MTSCYPLLPPELVGLAVACREAEHIECAGRIHLVLCEGKRLRTEILRHSRKRAIRHKCGRGFAGLTQSLASFSAEALASLRRSPT